MIRPVLMGMCEVNDWGQSRESQSDRFTSKWGLVCVCVGGEISFLTRVHCSIQLWILMDEL